MLVLSVSGLLGATALGAVWLAWQARGARRRWAVLSALVLGPDEVPEARTDLRFACVAWSLGLVVLALVLLPARASAAALAAGLLAAVPLGSLALAGLADLLRTLPFWRQREAASQERAQLHELLERARDELSVARDRVGGPHREALAALEEALDDYARELSSGAQEGLAERLHGVIDMARSCLLEEARQAARELGVRLNASPAEVQAVYQALQRIYGGEAALGGVDPERAARLELAYERLKLRFVLEQSARALRALARPGRAAAAQEPLSSGPAPRPTPPAPDDESLRRAA